MISQMMLRGVLLELGCYTPRRRRGGMAFFTKIMNNCFILFKDGTCEIYPNEHGSVRYSMYVYSYPCYFCNCNRMR